MINAEAVSRRDAEIVENLLSDLRLTNLKLGLVINFGQGRLIDGWERVVNNL